MPGWNKPTTDAKTYYDLPQQARNYVEVQGFFLAEVGALLTVLLVHREVCRSQGMLQSVGARHRRVMH